MAALVESMAYVREVPWHGLGTRVEEAMTSSEAMKAAGLDWNVVANPIFTESGIQIPGYVANTRDIDNRILGVVTDKYKIVQNSDAFAFTDNLIGDDCRYETAGSLKNGKTIWLLARLPRTKILGDDVDQYLCFSNTHDGTGSVKVFVTPVRVVCNNTLNIALDGAKRFWSCKHMGKMEDKLAEATHTLQLANRYMDELKLEADKLANTTLTDERLHQMLSELFPITEDATDRHKANMQKARNEFMTCYYMPDIRQFNKTAWGAVNAAADMAAHVQPQRNTQTYQERNFERVVVGHPILDKVMEMLSVRV